MTPFEWVLLAGALGTFVIIYQNLLSFQDTRIELENRLRERLIGKGDMEGGFSAKVDDIRVNYLSKWGKLKWYLNLGIDSSTEVRIETNVVIEDEVWEAITDIMTDTVEGEHLNTESQAHKGTGRSAIRIDSTGEKDIMQFVCSIPAAINELDLDLKVHEDADIPPSYPPRNS
jgi:hypothetical protein